MRSSNTMTKMLASEGFTLIELLVVIAIVGLVAALSLAGVMSARESARKALCLNNVHQIGGALSLHQSIYGIFPPQNPSPNNTIGSSFSYEGVSWHTYVLPFLDQQGLRNEVESAFQTNTNPLSSPHSTVARTVVGVYLCPSDRRLAAPLTDEAGSTGAFTSYVGMTGSLTRPASGVFGRRIGLGPGQIIDGLSTTILVGERPPPKSLSMGWWYNTHVFSNLMAATDYEVPAATGASIGDPTCGGESVDWPGFGPTYCFFFSSGSLHNECDKYHYWSLHSGGANFLFADGSARFLRYPARFQVNDMATIDGGEAVNGRD